MILLQILAYLVLMSGLILYLVGLLGGGLVNEELEHATHKKEGEEEEEEPHPAPAGVFGALSGFTRGVLGVFNNAADRVKVVGGMLITIASFILLVTNVYDGGWVFSTYLWVVIFCAAFAFFYKDVYADPAEKKASAFFIARWTWYALGAFLLVLFLGTVVLNNGRAWYETPVRTGQVTIGKVTEDVQYVKTPNRYFVNARSWDANPCGTGENPALIGYNTKCDPEHGLLLRAQWLSFAAFGLKGPLEYGSLEELAVAQPAERKDLEEQAGEISGAEHARVLTRAGKIRVFWGMVVVFLLFLLGPGALKLIETMKSGGGHPAPAASGTAPAAEAKKGH